MQTISDLPVPCSVVKCCFCRLIRVGGTSTICPFASCMQNFITRNSNKHIKAAVLEEVVRRPGVHSVDMNGSVCDSPGIQGQELIAAVKAYKRSESRTRLSHMLEDTVPDESCHNKHRGTWYKRQRSVHE